MDVADKGDSALSEPLLITSVDEMARLGREYTQSSDVVGLVPTMGGLHAGHISLVERARAECDRVVVSIFVNAIQFGDDEDLDAYPRTLDEDLAKCADAGADVVFAPEANDMYPEGFTTFVEVGELSQHLCGLDRPAHFRGVTTVVAKLLNLIRPDRAFFGQKDVQQFIVVRRMVRDLNIPVKIVACPIVREDDGLALSSRNVYLSSGERSDATCLSEALAQARELYDAGERDALKIIEEMAETVIAVPSTELLYAAAVDPETLQDVTTIDGLVLVALAVRIGQTRLIDNAILGD